MSPEITAALVKRHAHELRNCLNGVEMSLTLLGETSDDAQRKETIRKIRQEMRTAEAMVRSFAAKFLTEEKARFLAADMIEQWMVDARSLVPDAAITWDVQVGEAVLLMEPGHLRSMLSELLVMAARKASDDPLNVSCRAAHGEIVFTISNTRTHPELHPGDFSEQALWTFLGDFVAKNGGVLECSKAGIKLTLRRPVS